MFYFKQTFRPMGEKSQFSGLLSSNSFYQNYETLQLKSRESDKKKKKNSLITDLLYFTKSQTLNHAGKVTIKLYNSGRKRREA